MYLPWALRVLGALAGLVSHHPPEERTVEAAALNLHTLAGSSGSQLAIPPLYSPAHQSTPGSSTGHTGLGQHPSPLFVTLGQGWGQIHLCPLSPLAQSTP